jgi:replicative DNA helicase
MLLYSQTAELRAIRTLTSPKIDESVRSTWLGQLSKDYFHFEPCQRAFERIDKLAKKRFRIISFKALIEDPSLDEDMRDVLSTMSEKPAIKKSQRKETLETLDNYRKIRILYYAAKDTLEAMGETEVDVDSLLEEHAQAVARANMKGAHEEFFLNFGAHDSSDAIIGDILAGKIRPRIKSGFPEYDERSGGLPENGVMIIAATTSGGKSTIAMIISKIMYLVNKMSVLRITLEMQELQETQRLFSNLTGIPLRRFTQNKLTMADKALVKRKHKEYVAHGKKHGITYTTISPKGEMTIDGALRMAKPFGHKIIVIDYLGLLDGTDGDDQWKALNAAARTAKNYSRETGALVILLAQLDDATDKLRYARGIKEHADVMWQWNYSKPEQRESRVIPIQVSKDRDAELYTFDVGERFDVMNVTTNGGAGQVHKPDDSEDEDKPKKGGFGKGKNKKIEGKKLKGKKSKFKEDEDDDDTGKDALS